MQFHPQRAELHNEIHARPPQTVGTPVTGITITARDAANQTATGFTGTVTFGGTGGFSGSSAGFTAGVLTGVSVTPAVAGSNLTLAVDDGAGHGGSATIATIQTRYQSWSGGVPFGGDANQDGVVNGMAWVLGAAGPDAGATSLLPTFENSDPGFFIFTYRRADAAVASGAVVEAQYGSALAGWTTAVAGPDIVISETDDGAAAGVDLVQVKIRRTLAPDGMLFVRLRTVAP